uniref:acyl-[acyl-carrier-protein] thioesterase n=1 Tax=Acetatifactor sp. TaxID=1872090 RepID=UPI004055F891
MYSFESRIRYSELDCEGKLSMASLLNYFQDATTFHSEDLGVGVAYMRETHQVWVLSSWQIVVNRYPTLGEKVVVGTAPYDFKGFLGYRNFMMKTVDGEELAIANTLWSLLNLDTGKPALPPQEMLEKYVLDERLPMDYAPRKIVIPANGEKKEVIVVKKHHLDTNHHVNNGQYVDMAMEFLPEDFRIGQMRAEYKKQAFLEDELHPYVVAEKSKYVVNLTDAEGKTYVSVEFLRKGDGTD